ncbi:MAG: Gfo/Idh/MocA family oxidoreductase [Actinobacteria bacterium]|nr:Gfo/Idh/MocA family oxidoreductase [Actinomycetota bacterium]
MTAGRALDLLAARDRPLRVGLVGAGAFGSMVLSGAARVRGLDVVGVADLRPERAAAALEAAGLDPSRALDSAEALLDREPEVVVEATGSVAAALETADRALDRGCHVVMATVEADVVAGPLLAERARSLGLVYSLAYGDQPALICELVDWARAAGFEVVCAGKGTKHLPRFHAVTPDDVWPEYGLTPEQVERGGFDARMFTSFLDGTKSAVEMAAVCNATGLVPQERGLGFPPCAAGDLARVCVPGGALGRSGTVEVVSSLDGDGRELADHLRWGVFVTFTSDDERLADWLRAYGIADGRYGALWRPFHFIGLETTVSVLSAGLLREPTGAPRGFHADVVAVAKRDLAAGEALDGEGGFTVHGALVPAGAGGLPIGLARDVVLARPVRRGERVRVEDLEAPPSGPAAEWRARLLARLA